MRSGPLAGVRVVELAGQGPGPLTATMLADLGADVLRVERPGAQRMEPASDFLGRSRRSIGLDLKSVAGRAVLLELVRRADVLIDGFRPGVLERLDLGPDVLHVVRPDLVIGRMTGWGQEGPLAQRAGHDIVYLAVSGVLSLLGREDEPPVPPLNLVADYGGGGTFLAFGIACALLDARAAGRGTVIDAAMTDGVGMTAAPFHSMAQRGLLTGRRGDNLLDGGAPFYRCYATQEGRYVAVGAIEPEFYARLLAVLGIDPAEAPQRDRSRWPELSRRFADVFAQRTRDAWVEAFADADACFAPVLTLEEARRHVHAADRDAFLSVDGWEHPAPAPRFAGVSLDDPTPARVPGQDTRAILAELGHTEEEIARLLRDAAVWEPGSDRLERVS